MFERIIDIFKRWTKDITDTLGPEAKSTAKFAVENARGRKPASNCLCSAAISYGADCYYMNDQISVNETKLVMYSLVELPFTNIHHIQQSFDKGKQFFKQHM